MPSRARKCRPTTSPIDLARNRCGRTQSVTSLLALWAQDRSVAAEDSSFMTTTEVARFLADMVEDCAMDIETDVSITRTSVKAQLERLYLEQATLGALRDSLGSSRPVPECLSRCLKRAMVCVAQAWRMESKSA